MGLNLNKPVDFARLVSAPVGGLISSLTGVFDTEWDIQESSYGHDGVEVKFHIFKSAADYNAAVSQVQDTGGRRKSVFAFPYRDGQTTDDMGRQGETFSFQILIHGANYKQQFHRLIEEFNKPQPGILQHPVRGRLPVVCQSWTLTHEHSASKAVAINAEFIEHNFNVSFVSTNVESTVKTKLAKAVSFFAKFNAIVNRIESILNIPQSVVGSIVAGLAAFNDSYSKNLQRLNATFNDSGSDDLPGLLPTNSGGSGEIVSPFISPNDPFAGTPIDEIENSNFATLSTEQAIDSVAALRLQLNALIGEMSSALDGQGALEFYEDIKTLKQSGIAIQEVLEKGISTSSSRVSEYVTPRLMTSREVAFSNGLGVDRAIEIEVLNPSLLSVNYIEKGTSLKVPSE